MKATITIRLVVLYDETTPVVKLIFTPEIVILNGEKLEDWDAHLVLKLSPLPSPLTH